MMHTRFFSLKLVSLFAILFLVSEWAVAQNTDSIVFVSAPKKVERISKGARLVQMQFVNKDLFNANQFIAYAIIKNKKRKFNIAAEPTQLKTVSEFATAADATVSVNGNFFNVKEGGAIDYTKKDGVLINKNITGADGKLARHQKAAVAIRKGKLFIVKGGSTTGWADSLDASSVMANGPLLVYNNVNEELDKTSFSTNRHPRTAVGITKKGRIILLVADGRNTNAAGLSLEELTKLMRWLGCGDAINFDGGGSTTLWVKKKGVINHPADNKKWDHNGGRKVANVLYYRK